ncbi:ComEC/Rec2 family competence protein [Ostreibacterium oceani]|uniref:DUF4131 domain-containing protein n=1 Tax=Ostreibacterium oceani TaxID=2654998 RepID=A0A6N7EW38_9GAMM|nr:ComEC/Rec2 family competence protein [Ostreibacterium oceani]MPV86712.1 DUF4131 domain-containing protein [Ostreibacterium oceani]
MKVVAKIVAKDSREMKAVTVLMRAMRSVPDVVWLLSAQAITLIICLYGAWIPNDWAVLLALLVGATAFYRGYFLVLGLCLAVVALGWQTQYPATTSLDNCTFWATVKASGKATKRVLLATEPIDCAAASAGASAAGTSAGTSQLSLAKQTLLLWDNTSQFVDQADKRWQLTGRLVPVHSRVNAHDFDYEKYLISQSVYYELKSFKVLAHDDRANTLVKWRHALRTQFERHLAPNNAAIVTALVTGSRDELSRAQKDTMQSTGTSHLLAISGLHVGLVGLWTWVIAQGLWALFTRGAGRVLPIQVGAVVALVVIVAYAALTGFDTPVKRATIMFSLLIISWLMRRELTIQSLLLAAAMVLLVDPYALLSVGFYLSFIATYVVMWCARLSWPPFLKILMMQLLIMLVLLPIVWLTFGYISLSALAVNLLVIPWLTMWVLPWALLVGVASAIHPVVAAPIWLLLDFSVTAMWSVISAFDELDWILSPTFRPSLYQVIGWVSLYLVVLLCWRAKQKKPHRRQFDLLCGLSVLLGMLGLFLWPNLSIRQQGEFWLADERQTSVLVHNGSEAIIIDPGRRYRQINTAEKWQRLLSAQQLTLDTIVLTDDKISKISATATLLAAFPEATVITLKPMDLPFAASYCQPVSLVNIQLRIDMTTSACRGQIQWYDETFNLLTDEKAKTEDVNAPLDTHAAYANSVYANSVYAHAVLRWQGANYDAQRLGQVRLVRHLSGKTANGDSPVTLHYARQTARAWRHRVMP